MDRTDYNLGKPGTLSGQVIDPTICSLSEIASCFGSQVTFIAKELAICVVEIKAKIEW